MTEYYIGALWHRHEDQFVACWYSYLLLGDFTIERQSQDINHDLVATLMDPVFARFFPWQTASQFLALRGIHYSTVNVHRQALKWLDFWTFPYQSVWQNLADFQDRASWEANRRFFLEQCTVAKWLVNGGQHCLVHVMVDKDDTYYNRIDVGFYVFDVTFDPTFFVANTDNHDNYPWLSDGELGWSLICRNHANHCFYSQLEAEPMKKQKT